MNLDRENMKKLMLLITFTVVLLVGVQRLDVVLGTLNVIWTIFLPFVLGSAIAFFLNVPMAFLEKKLELDFPDAYRLLSATCDIQISQVVNDLKTVRVRCPKFDTGIPTL